MNNGFFKEDQQGQGSPVASWNDHKDNPGVSIQGTITGFSQIVATDYDTKLPKTNPDGSQKMQLRIVLARAEGPNNYADAKNPAVETVDGQTYQIADTGERALYAERGSNLSRAIGQALAEHGLDDLQMGGQLWVQYTGQATNPKTNRTYKEFRAAYKPAIQTAGFGFDQPQAPQQLQQQQFQQQAGIQAPPPQQFQQPVQQFQPPQPQYQGPPPQQPVQQQVPVQQQIAQPPVQQQYQPPVGQIPPAAAQYQPPALQQPPAQAAAPQYAPPAPGQFQGEPPF